MTRSALALASVLVAVLLLSLGCVVDLPPGDGGEDGTLVLGNLGPHDVTLGDTIQIELEVTGGVAPYTWRKVSAETGLEWATVSSDGIVSGTAPTTPLTQRTLRVEVRDSEERFEQGQVQISVGPCVEGATRECAEGVAGEGCFLGKQTCSAGQWSGLCANRAPSVDPEQCGESCGACGAKALRCNEGQCACGLDGGLPCPGDESCCPAGGDGPERCLNLFTDIMNCGSCGNVCPDPENATPTCNGGVCGSTCDGTFARCAPGPTDQGPCLINLAEDKEHCGRCNNPASPEGPGPGPNQHYTGNCVGGESEFRCDAGWTDCDGDPANGCEVHTDSDVNRCGSCTKQCTAPPGTETGSATCEQGQCGWDCGPEGRPCSEQGVESCKAYTNLAHCGACGNQCVVDPSKNVVAVTCQAQAAPTFGACKVAACAENFADCDGLYSNGCEVDIRTNTDHCGGCGLVCESTCVDKECCPPCGDVEVCCGTCTFRPVVGDYVCNG